jgi:hypothetical protein
LIKKKITLSKQDKKMLKALTTQAPPPTPVFSGVRVTWSLALYVCFVDRCLSFFFCLFFLDIQILITPLASSNSSNMQSWKLAPDRIREFPGSPVVFVISPDRLSGKSFCQPLSLRIDKSKFSVNST